MFHNLWWNNFLSNSCETVVSLELTYNGVAICMCMHGVPEEKNPCQLYMHTLIQVYITGRNPKFPGQGNPMKCPGKFTFLVHFLHQEILTFP